LHIHFFQGVIVLRGKGKEKGEIPGTWNFQSDKFLQALQPEIHAKDHAGRHHAHFYVILFIRKCFKS